MEAFIETVFDNRFFQLPFLEAFSYVVAFLLVGAIIVGLTRRAGYSTGLRCRRTPYGQERMAVPNRMLRNHLPGCYRRSFACPRGAVYWPPERARPPGRRSCQRWSLKDEEHSVDNKKGPRAWDRRRGLHRGKTTHWSQNRLCFVQRFFPCRRS